MRELRGLIPESVPVTILADRGLGRAEWAAVCHERKFREVVRIEPDVTISCSRSRGVLWRYPTKKGMAHLLKAVDDRKDMRGYQVRQAGPFRPVPAGGGGWVPDPGGDGAACEAGLRAFGVVHDGTCAGVNRFHDRQGDDRLTQLPARSDITDDPLGNHRGRSEVRMAQSRRPYLAGSSGDFVRGLTGATST
jgi:hypothetical protein